MNKQEMLRIETIDELDRVIFGRQEIYCYGAGIVCRKMLRYANVQEKGTVIKKIFVSQMDRNPKELYGISIQKNKNQWNEDTPIIIAACGAMRDSIAASIETNGKIFFLADDFEKELDLATGQINFDRAVKRIKNIASEGNRHKEDIRLFSPPYWDAYSPFSAVPCLVAKLRRCGFRVEQVDLGICCVHEVIRDQWRNVAEYCTSEAFYKDCVRNYRCNPYHSFEEYQKDMWFFQSENFDVEKVKSSYMNMNPVQKRIVDTFYSQICEQDVSGFDFENCKDLVMDVERYKQQNFLEYIVSKDILPVFRDLPSVIGISVTSEGQFPLACLLAEVLKKVSPQTTVLMGGSCADLFVQWSYQRKQDILRYFDYILVGEGETAITGLMEYLTGQRRSLDGIPNIAHIAEDGTVSFAGQIVEDVRELPPPDYDGLDLSLYLSPETILPYQTSRGCHYGQCAFCNHDEKYRHNYRSKDMKIVVDELMTLSQKYDVRNFQFVDEAIRPDCFRKMVDEMDRHEEFCHIRWFYYSRVSRLYDEELLRKAKKNGCVMVMFGVESFNQRLLHFIRKGISVETSRYCLKLFHNCGIKTYAWLMCNLPSETLEEAKKDLSDVQEMSDYIDAFSVGPFFLSRNTDMYAEPEKYNITAVDPDNPFRFTSHYEGEMIDKDAMLDFFNKEYAVYQREYFGTGNRYTLFFEAR